MLLTLVACQSEPTPVIDLTASRYFAATDQVVAGDFFYFYEVYGGQPSLGDPLTGEMVVDGWTVQYFENGRLERHPENEPRYQVTVGWLGEALGRRQPPIPASHIPPADDERRYFPQTGHTVSGDFRDYYEAHGDSVRFGQPISEPFLLAGQLCQDFQSARFFWTPTAASPVTLEAIGRRHLATLD